MKESSFRACAGVFSALLGLTLVIAACYHMYAEEVKYVGQQLQARELLDYAEKGECGSADPAHDGKLVFLRNCDLKSLMSVYDVQAGVLPSKDLMASVGGYTFCPEAPPVHISIPEQGPSPGKDRGEILLKTVIDLPGPVKASCEHAAKSGVELKKDAAHPDFEKVSVIAVQAAPGLLLRIKMESFGEVTGGVWVVAPGDHFKDSLLDELHVPRPAPQWMVVFLVFAGICAINVGVAEIPGYKIPGPCRVPQFQTCSLSLIVTIAVMITLCLCGTLFGFAWAKYHVLLSVPLFVASLTSMCLLIFVRFRCSYDGVQCCASSSSRSSTRRRLCPWVRVCARR